MKFLPTINVWNTGITTAIMSGQLKLQCGQWIQCGRGGVKSRFISCNGRSINAVHGGTIKQVNLRFSARIQAKKQAEEYQRLIKNVTKAEQELREFQRKTFGKA